MRRLTAVHPLLFAVFPILSLFATNVDIVSTRELAVPILVVGAATGLLWLLIRVFVGSGQVAGIVVSIFWLLFFSYAGLQDTLGLGHDVLVLVALTGLCVLIGYAAKRQRSRMEKPALIMTVAGLALVLMPSLKAVPGLIRRQCAPVAVPDITTTPARSDEQPDIYYIILDGYARADVLEDIYGYDNREFLDWLAEKGFYVAQRSRANYVQTYLSLASSLNYCYLDHVADCVGRDSSSRSPLREMLQENAVASFLKQRGYTYVVYSSGYFESDLARADEYRAAPGSLTWFQDGLVSMTPLSRLPGFQRDLHRKRLLYIFEHLPDAAEMRAPVFVFAHIVAPHPPFVFTEHGEEAAPSDSGLDAYTGQLCFVNAKVQAIIESILSASSKPPIIILQSDHGPGLRVDWSSPECTDVRERTGILNAYYLPGGVPDALYDEITPVNTFRLIFNEYFGADYDLLDDRSYVSSYDLPYQFTQVHGPSY
jgi:hypothetical protein